MNSPAKFKKQYPKNLSAQQNSIINAYSKLSVPEKSLLILCSPVVRLSAVKVGDVVLIKAADYAAQANIKINSAYTEMRSAAKTLLKKHLSFIDLDGNQHDCQWVSEVKYLQRKGALEISFPKTILDSWQVLDKDNPYTVFELSVALSLRGQYSARIYEYLQQYRTSSLGYRDLRVDELINKLQLSQAYRTLVNLRQRVIEPALKEINEKSNLRVRYDAKEPIKEGRNVVAYRIYIDEKTIIATDVTPKPKKTRTTKPKGKEVFENEAGQEEKLASGVLKGTRAFSQTDRDYLEYVNKKFGVEISEDYVLDYATTKQMSMSDALSAIESDMKTGGASGILPFSAE